MLKRLFVTGTDTDVGKTVVSRGLMQALAADGRSVAGYKPIAARCQETSEGIRNKDALVLQATSTLPLSHEEINPITCLDEVFHAHATEDINYGVMSSGLRDLSAKADTVVVEGSGGWRVLMNDLRPYAEWVVQEQLPVVLVVDQPAGQPRAADRAVDHQRRSAAAGLGRQPHQPGVGALCRNHRGAAAAHSAPLLGEIPYLPRAEQRELAHYLDISTLL